jgi:hypothetical protein
MRTLIPSTIGRIWIVPAIVLGAHCLTAHKLLKDDYQTPYPLPVAVAVMSPYETNGKPPAGSGTGNTVVADNPPSLARLNLPRGVNGTDEGML